MEERRKNPDPRIRTEVETCLRKERRRQLFRIAAVVAMVASVWVTSFQGRHNLVVSQREGCKRGKLDRTANARGWREAEHARRAAGENDVADEYARIATGLERRARINCEEQFPDPGPFSFGG